MSQYQPNATPSRSFISKIKNLSLSLTMQSMQQPERDGATDDDTLVHNAFVKYFDARKEAYPEWLGVKQTQQQTLKQDPYQLRYQQQNYLNSQYQPVRAAYNSAPVRSEPQEQTSSQSPQKSTYTPRSTSRLQDMYNKLRQQAIPGSGYNTQPAGPARSNSSSTSGSRLRERMLNSSPSMTGLSSHTGDDKLGGSRATWGRSG